MEASALPVPAGLARARLTIGGPLLRLRSDDQLVALFRSGNNEAFRVIHDRYRQRLFAYTRQMLPGSRQDAEDALQDVFVRAFGGLRSNDRELALRAWLYRIAHNRCIDELRRPAPPAPEMMELVRPPGTDPIHAAEQRESLRRLIEDVRRLPCQQRSALLMRELGGMSYSEVAAALEVSIPAVKSLLVRARVSLARALEARETSCVEIREDLIFAHDRGVRPTGMARRHMRDCDGCREFRGDLRGTSKQFAALLPLGPAAGLAKLLGIGGGAGSGAAAGTSAAGGGATVSTGAAAAGGIFGAGGAVASVGVLATGAGHVATLLAAAVVAAGGAVEIQHQITPAHHAHHHAVAVAVHGAAPASTPVAASSSAASVQPSAPVAPAPVSTPATPDPAPAPAAARPHRHRVTQPGPALPPQPTLNLNTPYGSSTGGFTGGGTRGGTGTGTGGSTTGLGGTTGTGGTGGSTTGTGTGSGSGSGSTGTTGGGTTGGSGSGTTGTGGTGSTPSTGTGPSPGGSAPGSTTPQSGGTGTPPQSGGTGTGAATTPATS